MEPQNWQLRKFSLTFVKHEKVSQLAFEQKQKKSSSMSGSISSVKWLFVQVKRESKLSGSGMSLSNF